MRKQGFRNVGLGLGALLVAASLSAHTGHAFAQQAVAPTGGPQEGIKVHGDWMIEVRDPDGRVVDRREFKNALHTNGGSFLSRLMGRQGTTGYWTVVLDHSGGGAPRPCDGFAGNPTAGCGIYENLLGPTLSQFPRASTNLQLNLLADRLQLTGSVTATTASTINQVYTVVSTCPASSAPATPCPGTPDTFSQTGLSSPIAVVAGQIIQVTVSFTFS